ncbi:DNA-formamidopyrimidine glycosylase [Oleiphilus sp. HI0125]|uniref:bifunctional DNA-formamidopyrimidine glycosylase/DNA-(apurinic or apyrimidinic site) lyase n=1 Tax=Oleiphilus sp. HI0125 TaxID=1822266 RepID=UPI0007C2213E|nr:bifunctional DNA-formamidopyrimidine glycosylase/DNA-(apurinic or apyrimidinic site) lyase [Oleiphilus sp. HI0125]KZZ57782.1 DNA-formamidopyrimidine glycosylase [Oleiphilus sp. HI0125]
MPELPEVETTRRGILPYSEGKVLQGMTIRNSRLRWPVSTELEIWSPNLVKSVTRRGKYIVMSFDQGSILIHLGMSGSLRVVSADTEVQKHDHVDFCFADHVLRFNDPRRFGSILWTEDWSKHELINKLGPEPLSDAFDVDYLHQKSKSRSIAVKQFIMDSHVVVGVGNIYANEALFLSGIHPSRAAGRISKKRYAELLKNIKLVLSRAIDQGGTTLRDFVGGDGKPGYFQQQLFVYGRQGEPCKNCGETLKEIRHSGRSTVFCSVCQK